MVEEIKSVEAYDELLAANKSVFVDFYADWCGPCKMVGPVVEKVSEDYADVKFARVNVDNVMELAQRYGIVSIPTLLAVKNGELVEKIVGFRPEGDIKTAVESIR